MITETLQEAIELSYREWRDLGAEREPIVQFCQRLADRYGLEFAAVLGCLDFLLRLEQCEIVVRLGELHGRWPKR